MSKIAIEKYSLKRLKSKFEDRDFAIPEIQRQYVWNRKRICNFLDSIYRNYPIGIGLMWHTKNSKALQVRPTKNTILPPLNIKNRAAELIIDGQQRLSTIYGVLKGVEEKPDANSYINFKEVFFNCLKKSDQRFVFSKRLSDDSKGYIRVTDILNMTSKQLRRKYGLNKSEYHEVKKCHERFHNYTFYLLSFYELNFNDVREVFLRINSGGMKVSRADSLFAYATNVKLRDHMLDVKRGLGNGFDSINVDAMQNTLALVYGAKRIGSQGISTFLKEIGKRKTNSNDFHKKWKDIANGYEKAVDFLASQFKISHLSTLPTRNIYTMLSYFFYLNKKRPNNKQIKELKKWFWHTGCGERYSGARFNRNIPKDIEFIGKLARNRNTKYEIDEKIEANMFLRAHYRKSSGSSSVASYFLMLRHNNPLYVANGSDMLLDNYTNISNRKDRHHIFPNELLKRNQINPTWINAIVNICYLESDVNQSFGFDHPKIYLSPYKKKKHFGKVMKSHLIPYDKKSPIWNTRIKTAYKDFINQRARIIISQINNLAGAKIFRELDPIKRI
jgi:hypothetical protein